MISGTRSFMRPIDPRPIAVPLVLVALFVGRPLVASEIAPTGEALARLLDSMDVERHWLAGRKVHWRTGTLDPNGHQGATHCSAFVAAACDRMGVYMLRPPDHSQTLLANAQNAWLKHAGAQSGWRRVSSAVEAQRLANLGILVVASLANPDRHRPGHIALVRPSPKGDAEVAAEGPQVIQAGRSNSNSVSLVQGFIHHQDAWKNGEIEFFAHAPNFQGPR
jgi:hypothetical protein